MTLYPENRNVKTGSRRVLIGAAAAGLILAVALLLWTRSAERTQAPAPTVEGLLEPGNPDFEKYRPLVTLTLQKLTLAKNYAGNRMVNVAAGVHNGTDRWIEALQVQVTLRNASQTVLQQKRFVLMPGTSAKPVAPEADFGFSTRVEQIPEEWMGDGADVQISGLKFRAH
jgi:hypothetical protein